MRRALCALSLLVLSTITAVAQQNPSGYPVAPQPLGPIGTDAVALDICQPGLINCNTKQSPSVRIGQPVQQTTPPVLPFLYQHWINTSASPPEENIYTGSTWFPLWGLSPTQGIIFNIPASSISGLGTMATQNASAVAITGGSITGLGIPINPTDVATKQYVDNSALGLFPGAPVQWATAANTILPNSPAYANGASGVGATLTASGNAAIVIDGGNPVLNDRVLVKNQSSQLQNGVYAVTTVGSGSVPWVLTRATDFNTATLMRTNTTFFVNGAGGATNSGTNWAFNTPEPIIVGTTALTFVQIPGSTLYTAGTGLSLIGTVFSITNTGITAGSYGTATAVPTITYNLQGQAQSATNTPIAIPASQISNGTTGSGTVVLSTNPTFGNAITVAGQGSIIGSAAGNENAPTPSNTNLLLYVVSPTTNWSGIGSHTDGTMYFVTGTSSPTTRMEIQPNGLVSIFGSVSVSAGSGYDVGGAPVLTRTGAGPTYTELFDGSLNGDIFLGGNGDATNYYRNTTHVFGSIGGGSTFATLNGTGLSVNGNYLFLDGQTCTVSSGGGPCIYADTSNLVLKSVGNQFLFQNSSGSNIGILNNGGLTLSGALTVNGGTVTVNSGNMNISGIYQIGGTQISAGSLSNGVAGSGAIVLQNSPTIITPSFSAVPNAYENAWLCFNNGTQVVSYVIPSSQGGCQGSTLAVPALQAGSLTVTNTGAGQPIQMQTTYIQDNGAGSIGFYANGGTGDFVTAGAYSTSLMATIGASTLCYAMNEYQSGFNGITICASDGRLKDLIGPVAGGTAIVDQLKPIEFGWKPGHGDTARHAGFVAQDVLQVAGECVGQGPDGMYSIETNCLTAYIAKAIQELDHRVSVLEAR